jgi:hypothetical protein
MMSCRTEIINDELEPSPRDGTEVCRGDVSQRVDRCRAAATPDCAVRVLQVYHQNPEQMVTEIFNVETQTYRKRNFYAERVKEFSAQIPGSWSERTGRGNTVRSFFIANGRRLPNEKPEWL